MTRPEPPIRAFRRRLLRLIDEHFEGRYTRFATRAGIPVSTMQHYLHHARHLPGGEHLMRMAVALGVTVQALITGEEAGGPTPRRLPRVPGGPPRGDRPAHADLPIPVVRCGCPGTCPLTAEGPGAPVADATLVLPTAVLPEPGHRLLATVVGEHLAAAEWPAGTRLVVDTETRTPTWDELALIHTEGRCQLGHLTQIADTILFAGERDGDFRVIQREWRILGTVVAGVVPLARPPHPGGSGRGRRGRHTPEGPAGGAPRLFAWTPRKQATQVGGHASPRKEHVCERHAARTFPRGIPWTFGRCSGSSAPCRGRSRP
jgi:hypothetical protein